MSWVGRFGRRPHRLVTQDELFAMVIDAAKKHLHCTICEGSVAGVLHCNDCGWTRRMCDGHRPDSPEAEHLKKSHAAICNPAKGSD